MNVTIMPLSQASPQWKTQCMPTAMPLPHGSVSSMNRPATLSPQMISWLWVEMVSIYGQMFITKNGTSDSGIWFDVLGDLSPKALETGVARLKGLSGGTKFCDWPPNPLNMKALCLAFYDELKLPSAAEAYREIKNMRGATRKSWSHAVVKFTACRLPSGFLNSDNEQQLYMRFKAVYEQVCNLVKQGNEIPGLNEIKEPAVCLPAPVNRNIGHSHLAAMKQRLGV